MAVRGFDMDNFDDEDPMLHEFEEEIKLSDDEKYFLDDDTQGGIASDDDDDDIDSIMAPGDDADE